MRKMYRSKMCVQRKKQEGSDIMPYRKVSRPGKGNNGYIHAAGKPGGKSGLAGFNEQGDDS